MIHLYYSLYPYRWFTHLTMLRLHSNPTGYSPREEHHILPQTDEKYRIGSNWSTAIRWKRSKHFQFPLTFSASCIVCPSTISISLSLRSPSRSYIEILGKLPPFLTQLPTEARRGSRKEIPPGSTSTQPRARENGDKRRKGWKYESCFIFTDLNFFSFSFRNLGPSHWLDDIGLSQWEN